MTKFKAVVFDWAGTMIDFGSFAPMGVFVEAFKRFGLDATIAEARAPMGAPKRDHIKAMLMAPAHGRAMGKAAWDRTDRSRYRPHLCRFRADERKGRRRLCHAGAGGCRNSR